MNTLIAAAIAALVSLTVAIIGVMTTRHTNNFNADLEIAKFRELRIHRLRDTLSEFQSYAMLPNSEPDLQRKFYELGTKIELLLNRDDPLYERLQNVMYQMLEASKASKNAKYSLNPEFVEVSQDILRQEWKLVKSKLRQKKKQK